jgi:hypothetical protein
MGILSILTDTVIFVGCLYCCCNRQEYMILQLLGSKINEQLSEANC